MTPFLSVFFSVQARLCHTQPCTAPETESMSVSPLLHYHRHTISDSLYQLWTQHAKSLFYWKGISHPKDMIEDLDMRFISGGVLEDKRYKKHFKFKINIYRIQSDELF